MSARKKDPPTEQVEDIAERLVVFNVAGPPEPVEDAQPIPAVPDAPPDANTADDDTTPPTDEPAPKETA